MIDPNRSIVIFSHPRSGSTWFQNSLIQYNLNELFLLHAEISGFNSDRISLTYKENISYEDPAKELQRRFDIYNEYASKQSVSVKIHTASLNKKIVNFIEQQDTQFVLLERKNKIDTLMSALIAWHTLNWHKKAVPTNLTIKKEIFDSIINWMKSYKNECMIVKSIFDVKELYYEDFINYPKSEWFNPAEIIIQNAKSVTTIDNIDEVNQWISLIEDKSIL